MTPVSVVAPSDLGKGYSFQVVVDGKPVEITCPRDLKKGEPFEVATMGYDERATDPFFRDTNVVSSIGQFQYGLCSCCDGTICCGALWWNTWCLQCIPVAQLLNRFRWDACGFATKRSRVETFIIVCILYLLRTTFTNLGELLKHCETTEASPNEEFPNNDAVKICTRTTGSTFCEILGWFFIFYTILLLVRIRQGFRKHYNIHGTFCGDFWTMFCCSCCSVIQMLRQTHDETQYPYSCCNCLTGLPEDAPEISTDSGFRRVTENIV